MTLKEALAAIEQAGLNNWEQVKEAWQIAFDAHKQENPHKALSGVKCKPCRFTVHRWLSNKNNAGQL